MARFCKYCGSPLEDGQVCTCPQAQAEAAQAQQPGPAPQPAPGQYSPAPAQPSAPSPVGLAFKNLLPYLKSYVSSPVNATNTVLRQNDMFLSIILLAIQAIVGGLLMFAALFKVDSMINALISAAVSLGGSMAGLGSGLSGVLGAAASPTVSASFIMCFIFGILASLIAAALFVVLAFAVSKLCGSDCSFLQIVIVCGANTPFVIVLMLLSFILFFLSLPLGIVFFLFAMLAWLILTGSTIQAVTPNAGSGKFWILCIVAAFLILLIGSWIGSGLVSASMGASKISYMGQSITINEIMKAAGDVDFGELFQELMEDAISDIF